MIPFPTPEITPPVTTTYLMGAGGSPGQFTAGGAIEYGVRQGGASVVSVSAQATRGRGVSSSAAGCRARGKFRAQSGIFTVINFVGAPPWPAIGTPDRPLPPEQVNTMIPMTDAPGWPGDQR